METLTRKLIKPTFVFASVIAFMVYIFALQPVVLRGSGANVLTTFDYSYLLAPGLIVSGCLYGSVAIGILTMGKASEALRVILMLGSVPWALLWLSTWSGFPAQLSGVVYAFCGVTALVQLGILARGVSGVYGERMFLVFGSVMFLVAGYVIGLLVTGLVGSSSYAAYAPQLGSVAMWTFAVTGLSALLGALKEHVGGVLSRLSVSLSKGLHIKFVAFLAFFTYVFLLRGILSLYISSQQTYLTISEWLVVSLGTYVAFRTYQNYAKTSLSTSEPAKLWGRHSQRIDWQRDRQMGEVSDAIKVFVEGGGKEILVTQLVQIMSTDVYGTGSMAEVISPLVNHRDAEKGILIFSWQAGYLEKVNHDSRRKAVEETMRRLESYLQEGGKVSASGKKTDWIVIK